MGSEILSGLKIISDLGFPIVVAMYLLLRVHPTLLDNRAILCAIYRQLTKRDWGSKPTEEEK